MFLLTDNINNRDLYFTSIVEYFYCTFFILASNITIY